MSQSIADVAAIIESEIHDTGGYFAQPKFVSHYAPITTGENIKQLNITAKITEEWPVTILYDLALQIIKFNNIVKCNELILPANSIIISCLCRRNKLLFRYLEDYVAMEDTIYKRIDILISK